MILDPTWHPKEISRNKLQEKFITACKYKLQELLKIDKCMIDYHNPENLRKITIPSLLKPCVGLENSATYHADKLE